MRDYHVMREVLKVTATCGGTDKYSVFRDLGSEEDVDSELTRLIADGLIDGVIEFGAGGALSEFGINGLTEEGREFYKLVENYDVWRLIRETLDAARVDVSYPLLKEVCEEIVKRYVTSFIPKKLERGNTV